MTTNHDIITEAMRDTADRLYGMGLMSADQRNELVEEIEVSIRCIDMQDVAKEVLTYYLGEN